MSTITYQSISIPEHYVEHNGHFDFHEAHTGYIESGSMPQLPSNPPVNQASSGYEWIGIPRHFDYHNGHYDIEDAHWALAKDHH